MEELTQEQIEELATKILELEKETPNDMEFGKKS